MQKTSVSWSFVDFRKVRNSTLLGQTSLSNLFYVTFANKLVKLVGKSWSEWLLLWLRGSFESWDTCIRNWGIKKKKNDQSNIQSIAQLDEIVQRLEGRKSDEFISRVRGVYRSRWPRMRAIIQGSDLPRTSGWIKRGRRKLAGRRMANIVRATLYTFF